MSAVQIVTNVQQIIVIPNQNTSNAMFFCKVFNTISQQMQIPTAHFHPPK